MGLASQAQVEQLREKIRKLEAQPRQWVMALRTGFEELDAFGAFRLGTGVELCGEEASGRTTIALSVVAAAGKEKRLSAWVDGPQELYPPAAVTMGVDLSRLLIARPKSPGQLVWTAVQLLRSGAFTCVVLDVTGTRLRLSMIDAKKLLDATRTGGSLLVLLTSESAPAAGFPRLKLSRFEVETPHGKRAQVEVPVRFGYHLPEQVPWDAPDPLPVLASDSLQRPKKNVLRDGYPFCAGSSHGGGAMGGWMHPRESHVQVAPALKNPLSLRQRGEGRGEGPNRAQGPSRPSADTSGRGEGPNRAQGPSPPRADTHGRGEGPNRAQGPSRPSADTRGRGEGPNRAQGPSPPRADTHDSLSLRERGEGRGEGPIRAQGLSLSADARGADPPRDARASALARGADPPRIAAHVRDPSGADPPRIAAHARAPSGADPPRIAAHARAPSGASGDFPSPQPSPPEGEREIMRRLPGTD